MVVGSRRELFHRKPSKKIKKVPHESPEGYTPPIEDMEKVVAVADRTERIFLDSYLNTGARRSEVFKLKWDKDIDLKHRRVRLTTRKNKDGHFEHEWVPMSQTLYDELTWWWDNRSIKDTPYVFVADCNRHYGKPFTTRRRFLKGLCERAGVKPFQYHALRRYVASLLAQKYNVSIRTIQRVLRHKNLRTTELYIKDINRDDRGVYDLLGKKVPNRSAQRILRKAKYWQSHRVSNPGLRRERNLTLF